MTKKKKNEKIMSYFKWQKGHFKIMSYLLQSRFYKHPTAIIFIECPNFIDSTPYIPIELFGSLLPSCKIDLTKQLKHGDHMLCCKCVNNSDYHARNIWYLNFMPEKKRWKPASITKKKIPIDRRKALIN